MDIEKLINELNKTDEHHRIEAKTASSQVGKSVMETVSAFSNEPEMDGGYILLGVERDDASMFPSYTVVGVDDPDQVSADVSSQCASMFNRRVRPRVETAYINDAPVIGIYVPEAEPGEKPIYLESQGLPRGAYRRIGSSDQACNEDDLLVLYEGRRSESFDTSILPDASIEDIDREAVEEYRQARADVNPDAEELAWSDEDLLRALNCLKVKDGVLRPTVAGILLFGRKIALRRLFPAMRVDYIRVPGREWISDPEERFSGIEMRGPIIQVIRRAQAAVMDDLPKGFSLPEGSIQRTEEPVIPRRALREAIVNALMHRSYRVHSPVQIIRYSNRIEIRNPGYSLKAEERLGEVGSEMRNPAIAAVLHETGIAETKGSGIRVMRQLMEKAGLAPPTFESRRGDNKFVARLLMHHFLEQDDIEWLSRFKGLSSDQMKALVFVREVGAIDNATYRQLNGVETLTASNDLRKLRDADLLEMKGQSTATYYEATTKLFESLSSDPKREIAEEVREKTQGSGEKTQGSGEKTQGSGEKTQASQGKTQGVEKKTTEEETLDKSKLPKHLRSRVDELGSWTPKEELREVILNLCDWRALSAEEIARLTDRDRRYLFRKHLIPLLKAGKLEQTIPEMPKHPNQTYRTASKDPKNIG